MIYQIVEGLVYGDAVGNDIISLKYSLDSMGYANEIYANSIDSRVTKGIAKLLKKIPKIQQNDIILYHLAVGTSLNYKFQNMNGRKVLIYHNITPPYFFSGYNATTQKDCAEGLIQVKDLADKVEYCIADSEYNKQDLINMGFKCKIYVIPILIKYEDYRNKPNAKIINKYNDGKPNILFTGRIAPNKKQEDIISSFYYYKKFINKEARLFLVGSFHGMEKYKTRLEKYIMCLNLEDVYITGHVKFDEILAYYNIADIFVSMSEHEGFCVPLVEAMYFSIPIIAYDSSAVGETLGDSSFILDNKDPKVVAESIDIILKNKNLKDIIINNQRIRLQAFDNKKITEQFKKVIQEIINI